MKPEAEMPSAIIDLDVITVAHWKGQQKKEADVFLGKLTSKDSGKELYIVTPFLLIGLLMEWRNKELAQRIEDFYLENTDLWLSDRMIKEQAELLGINLEALITRLEKRGVKQEDSVLVAVAAIFKIEYLITFNRKHLLSKQEAINGELKEAGLCLLKIRKPGDAAANGNASGGNHLKAFSLFKNLADIPAFILSANLTGSTFSGITALAFHFLSFTKSSMALLFQITFINLSHRVMAY
jgi:hypothetical protein